MYLAYLSLGPGYIQHLPNPRMYYLLRTCRTTNELKVFVFVAIIIHLGKVNSLSPFKDCETPR